MDTWPTESFINREDRTNKNTRKNCEFEYIPEAPGKKKLWVVITKHVKTGQELFTTYGRGMRLVNVDSA